MRDDINNVTNSKSKSGNYKDRDGTYVLHWTYRRYSHYSSAYARQQVHLKLVPQYYIATDESKPHRGAPYEVIVYSDRTYDEIDDGTGFGMSDINYSRQARQPLDDDADSTVEAVLDAIEAPDGTVVWQRNGVATL